MKKYKGTHYWVNGFENHFWITATKTSLEAEIKHAEGLTWVERTVIIDESTGETLYDEQGETAKAASSKKDGGSNRTKAKKASSKKTRSHAESKRAVCRPQDAN